VQDSHSAPTTTPVKPVDPRPRRSIAVWLNAFFWLVLGGTQFSELVRVIPLLASMNLAAKITFGVAAMIAALALCGAVLVILRRRLAFPVLLVAFLLGSIPLAIFVSQRSFLALDPTAAFFWLLSAASTALVFSLYRGGTLT
jgi:hypothetical protein